MDQPGKAVYEFGPFRFDAEQRLLFRDGELVSLAPKMVETLRVLLDRRGRVVDKTELMKLVWPDTLVEDVGLARNISLLRKALGDESDSAAYIETIPKRGYRFVAEVQVAAVQVNLTAPRTSRRWLIAAAGVVAVIGFIYWQFYAPSKFLQGGGGLASLAVVPFETLTPELDRSGFSQGLTELLVADLTKLAGVYVVSPSTVRRYQSARISMSLMGRLLGLEVLVEGTVQKWGDRVRIMPRLVDVHTGKLIWAENYEYPAADLGQAEFAAAEAISAQVGAHLAVHEQFPRASH